MVYATQFFGFQQLMVLWCMYVCMYIYILFMHIYIYIHIYIYAYIHIHICMHIYIVIYICIYICGMSEVFGSEAAALHRVSSEADSLRVVMDV